MAFARVETGILNHRKFLGLIGRDVRANTGLAAVGAWTLGLAYSMDQLTDGRVPKAWLRQVLRANIADCSAEHLIAAGLWHDKGDHWLIHDYLEWNPSASKIKADRQAARARMSRRRGSPERAPEQEHDSREHRTTFGRTQNAVRQQDVEVEREEEQDPRTSSSVRANSHPEAKPPSPPAEAFNSDCPDRRYVERRLCVNRTFWEANRDAFRYPMASETAPKQCPHHRVQTSASEEEVQPAW